MKRWLISLLIVRLALTARASGIVFKQSVIRTDGP